MATQPRRVTPFVQRMQQVLSELRRGATCAVVIDCGDAALAREKVGQRRLWPLTKQQEQAEQQAASAEDAERAALFDVLSALKFDDVVSSLTLRHLSKLNGASGAVADMIKCNRSLLSLHLDDNFDLAMNGLELAVGISQHTMLQQISVRGCLSPVAFHAILNAAGACTDLRTLSIEFLPKKSVADPSSSALHSKVSVPINVMASLLHSSHKLVALSLAGFPLHGNSLCTLLSAVRAHSSLRALTLRRAQLDDHDAPALISLLSHSARHKLCVLDLSENDRLAMSNGAIVKAIEGNKRMREYSMGGRTFTRRTPMEPFGTMTVPVAVAAAVVVGDEEAAEDSHRVLESKEQDGAEEEEEKEAKNLSTTEPCVPVPDEDKSDGAATAAAAAGDAVASVVATLSAASVEVTVSEPVSPLVIMESPNDEYGEHSVTEPCVPTEEEMQAMLLAAAIRRLAVSSNNASAATARAAAAQELGVPGVPWDAAMHGAEPCVINTTPVLASIGLSVSTSAEVVHLTSSSSSSSPSAPPARSEPNGVTTTTIAPAAVHAAASEEEESLPSSASAAATAAAAAASTSDMAAPVSLSSSSASSSPSSSSSSVLSPSTPPLPSHSPSALSASASSSVSPLSSSAVSVAAVIPAPASELTELMRAEMAAMRDMMQQQMEARLAAQAQQFEATLAARMQQHQLQQQAQLQSPPPPLVSSGALASAASAPSSSAAASSTPLSPASQWHCDICSCVNLSSAADRCTMCLANKKPPRLESVEQYSPHAARPVAPAAAAAAAAGKDVSPAASASFFYVAHAAPSLLPPVVTANPVAMDGIAGGVCGSDDEQGSWSCALCTFVNSAEANGCAMCGQLRSAKEHGAVAEMEPGHMMHAQMQQPKPPQPQVQQQQLLKEPEEPKRSQEQEQEQGPEQKVLAHIQSAAERIVAREDAGAVVSAVRAASSQPYLAPAVRFFSAASLLLPK
jgi:hypothetical protein